MLLINVTTSRVELYLAQTIATCNTCTVCTNTDSIKLHNYIFSNLGNNMLYLNHTIKWCWRASINGGDIPSIWRLMVVEKTMSLLNVFSTSWRQRASGNKNSAPITTLWNCISYISSTTLSHRRLLLDHMWRTWWDGVKRCEMIRSDPRGCTGQEQMKMKRQGGTG